MGGKRRRGRTRKNNSLTLIYNMNTIQDLKQGESLTIVGNGGIGMTYKAYFIFVLHNGTIPARKESARHKKVYGLLPKDERDRKGVLLFRGILPNVKTECCVGGTMIGDFNFNFQNNITREELKEILATNINPDFDEYERIMIGNGECYLPLYDKDEIGVIKVRKAVNSEAPSFFRES
jgi:hypothetical protein